jgi:cysteine synthase A
MENRSKLYIAGAFALGVLLTLGYKDVYPDLERRFRERWRKNGIYKDSGSIASIASPVVLRDVSDGSSPCLPEGDIREGIEGCIGNTPLIRIKSLSEATGCEILAKAEVLALLSSSETLLT